LKSLLVPSMKYYGWSSKVDNSQCDQFLSLYNFI
jgi:hypothetical protein